MINCPYCGKLRHDASPGKFRCTRCAALFQVHKDLSTAKISRNRPWETISLAVFAPATIALVAAGFLMPHSLVRSRILWAGVGVVGVGANICAILNAVTTGVMWARGCVGYREDSPAWHYYGYLLFCSLFGATAAVVGILGLCGVFAGGST